MIALFTIIYCVAIWLIFYKMKIKPNPTNVAVAVVIGVVAIGAIVVLWTFSSPSSGNLVVSRYTVQIVPQVKGPITKIHAEPNVPVKKGVDLLVEIQPDTYQFAVDQTTASLAAAEQNVNQQEAGVKVAAANIKQAQANLAATKAELDVAKETERINPAAVAKLVVVQAEQQYNAALASVEQVKAAEAQATAGLEEARSTVGIEQAKLEAAKFNLAQCKVYAPADGFVTNWQVREGTMAVSLPFAPIGTFIDTSRTSLVANFGQNIVKNVKPGDPVEISLKTKPGEVLTGKVEAVIQATGEGQFVTSGTLGSAADLSSSGMFVLKFELDDEELNDSLAMGTAGMVVIYTDTGKPFHVISKVTVRINAWMYYLMPF
jgi:multidrug resistance efflux pump